MRKKSKAWRVHRPSGVDFTLKCEGLVIDDGTSKIEKFLGWFNRLENFGLVVVTALLFAAFAKTVTSIDPIEGCASFVAYLVLMGTFLCITWKRPDAIGRTVRRLLERLYPDPKGEVRI
jgi:hypothetical protein